MLNLGQTCTSTYLCHVYDYIVTGAFRRWISLARAIYDQKLVFKLKRLRTRDPPHMSHRSTLMHSKIGEMWSAPICYIHKQ